MATVVIDINLGAEDASAKAKDLANSIKAIKEEQKALKKSGEENSASYAQNAQQLRTLQSEQKSYLQLAQSEIGSNNQLRAQLALLSQQYNALSKEERENTLAGQAMQTQMRGLSDELKKNESIVGDNRRNVGNYRGALKDAGNQLAAMVPELQGVTEGFNLASSAIKGNITGLGFLKAALVATGIGAILVLLGSLVAYFKSTEDGAERLERGIAGLKGAFSAFLAPLAKVGEFLVDLFTNPIKALQDFKKLLSGNLLSGIKEFGKSVVESTNNAVNVKQLEQNAEDAGRALNRQASKLRTDAAILRAKGDAESLKQAEANFRKADQLTQQAVNAEIKAQQAYIKLREKNGQARDEDYDKLNSLYAKIDQSRQTDGAKAEKANARREKMEAEALRKKQERVEKEREAITILQQSEQNILNLTMDARKLEITNINIEFDEKIKKYKEYGKVTEALERERTAKILKVSEQFHKEDLAKTAEFAAKVEQETFKSIDLQIAGMKEGDEKKLAQIVSANAKQVAEIDRQITASLQLVSEGDTKQNELIEQLQTQRNEIIRQTEQQRTEFLTTAELERQEALAQLALDTAQTPEAQLAAEQELLTARTALKLQAAEGDAAAIAEINARHEATQNQLDEANLQNKINRVQQFGQAFQEIMGKNTTAARVAAAVAEKIDAAQQLRNNILIIQEQVKAIVSQGKLVFPLNVGAILATVAALATGIAAAKSLTKGFAEGGVFTSDGRGAVLPGYSKVDNTNAKLRSGEAVIVSEATRDPRALAALSAINVAYGGRPLAPGYAMASGGISSGSFVTDISDNAARSVDITNAIILGMRLAPAPIVDVRDITSQQQRNNNAVVNATI